jgi:hypothetical protein
MITRRAPERQIRRVSALLAVATGSRAARALADVAIAVAVAAAVAELSDGSFPEAAPLHDDGHSPCQWSSAMKRTILALMACLALGACGLGATAVSATGGGAAEAEQAKAALEAEARAKQQLDAAATLEAQRREAADASAQ